MIELMRTGVAFILFPIGIALTWAGDMLFRACVWLTQDNKEWKFRAYEPTPRSKDD